MTKEAMRFAWWKVWGTTRRPWWLHGKRDRDWRKALTFALVSVSLGGCASAPRDCGDLNANDCRQMKADYRKATTQHMTEASYHYGEGKSPLWNR